MNRRLPQSPKQIGFESWNETSFAVPLVEACPEASDTIEDILRERLEHGLSIKDPVDQYMKAIESQIRGETLITLVCILMESNNPKMDLQIIALRLNLILIKGNTLSDIAREHGVRKQAVNQRGARLAHELKLPKAPWMRSEEAVKKMRVNNFRRRSSTIQLPEQS